MGKIVRVHNNFIEACYKANLLEKKLLMFAIHKFNKIAASKVEKSKIYYISADKNELKDALGFDVHKDYTDIKRTCKSLNEKVVTLEDKDKKNFKTFSMITDTEFENGTLTLGFHWRIFPYFRELKEKFTKYDLINIKELTSSYSIRFYELIKQYENIGARTLKIEYLRKIFELEDKYVRHDAFRINVIDRAQKELKEKSDLYFDYIQNRKGRKVISITLNIKLNIRKAEKTYLKASIERYFNQFSEVDFYKDLRKYYEEKQNHLSIEDKKYMQRIIVEKQNYKTISDTLLYRFFTWQEPELGL